MAPDASAQNRRVSCHYTYTDDILYRAFGVTEHPSWDDFERFLQDCCFPRSRGNCRELFQEMNLTAYDPLQIVEKTQGRLADNEMWLELCCLPKGGSHMLSRKK